MRESAVLDVLLLSTAWPFRALLRAQLIEEGFDVAGVDTWSAARTRFLRGARPRLLIIDLDGLADVETALRDCRALMDTNHVLLVAAAGTPPPEGAGFRVLRRPIDVSTIVAEASRALGHRRV